MSLVKEQMLCTSIQRKICSDNDLMIWEALVQVLASAISLSLQLVTAIKFPLLLVHESPETPKYSVS